MALTLLSMETLTGAVTGSIQISSVAKALRSWVTTFGRFDGKMLAAFLRRIISPLALLVISRGLHSPRIFNKESGHCPGASAARCSDWTLHSIAQILAFSDETRSRMPSNLTPRPHQRTNRRRHLSDSEHRDRSG